MTPAEKQAFDAMRSVLLVYQHAVESGMVKADLKMAYQLAERAIDKADAVAEQSPAPDIFKDAVHVAICELFAHHKKDVLKKFTINELEAVALHTESLKPRQIEDIYRAAFDAIKKQAQGPRPMPDLTVLAGRRMELCPDCGNKRCPKANHPNNACTNSNAIGQKGSTWEHVSPLQMEIAPTKQTEQLPTQDIGPQGECSNTTWCAKTDSSGTHHDCCYPDCIKPPE